MFEPKQMIVETGDLAFGLRPPRTVSFELQMFEDIVSDPTYTITAPSPVPFTFAIEQSTFRPRITLTLTETPDKIQLGHDYVLNINGPDNKFVVKFLYNETYRPTDWRMSAPESVAGNAYHFKELEHGTKMLTMDINSKFKMLFEYVFGLTFKLMDLSARFETRKRMRDIIDCAVNGGAFPKNCTVNVVRDTSDHKITELLLRYSDSEQPYTSVKYLYTDALIEHTFDDPAIGVVRYTKPVLYRIEINRVSAAAENSPKRYAICTVQFHREYKTYISLFGSSVHLPLITKWDVIE